MLAVFLKTVPFFLIIAIGYGSARARMFTAEGIAYITKFVFYFALSAMLFRFAAELSFSEIWNTNVFLAYLSASAALYVLVTAVALLRGTGFAEAAVEAQCGVIGNTGFLGLPMLVILIGEQAAGPIILMLAIDLIVFGSLIVVIILLARGTGERGVLPTVGLGLVQNPMVMSMSAGLLWSASSLPLPEVAAEFLLLLGAAATPCALFAIGASLAGRSAERLSVALWLSVAKLFLHPLAVGIAALFYFDVPGSVAGIMVATSAMPVAGNIFIIAQTYGVAPARASSAILVSTVIAVGSLAYVISLVT
ncbi:MAG: AEC family transporter [Pseudomonadota bacterium]